VSLNNHDSSTCKYDLIQRTENKHFNALETKLSKKNILFRIAKGDTLVINHIQEFDEDVNQLLNYFSNKFYSNCNANIYYAYKNTMGINLHFDLHDILAIQFYGKKKWTIVKQKGDTSQTIEKSEKPKLNKLNNNDVIKIETEIGDILFIPKGVWHYAQTNDDSSLHFALSLNPINTNELFKYFLSKKLNNIGEENLYDISKDNIKTSFKSILNQLDKVINSYSEEDARELLQTLSKSENINLKLT
jgi:ribosomal protein L16 Arg81 hydroxylase